MDIFTCSRMLIPVNIKLKHWILSCIDFEQKWMAWLDSIGDTHEQETRLLFTWLTREYSLNRSTIFDPVEWSLHSGPPTGMQVPLQSNDFDCGIFICLYAAFLDIRLGLPTHSGTELLPRSAVQARIVSRHWGPPRACYRVPYCE